MSSVVLTPTVRRATRRSLFWILAAGFLVLLALGALAVNGASKGEGTPFSASNAEPAGSKAVAAVLADHGVTVHVPATLAAAASVLDGAGRSTLFLYDPQGYLDAGQLRSLAGRADRVVLFAPAFAQLRALAPEVAPAGTTPGKALMADCPVPAVERAVSVSAAGLGYRIVEPGDTTIGCLGTGTDVFSLVQVDRADGRIVVLGTTDALRNDRVAERGNAALALGLLGSERDLVWYLPTIDDAAIAGAPTIAQLTPAWVGPVLALLAVVAIAAAVWRGRRMGALVVEDLPVTVRASETMEGRARLYQRSGARLRALDALRIGTVGRLAAVCGLPRLAPLEDVIGAVSAAARMDPASVRALLVETVPRNDAELVRLSDALLDLERTITAAVRPGNRPEIQGE